MNVSRLTAASSTIPQRTRRTMYRAIALSAGFRLMPVGPTAPVRRGPSAICLLLQRGEVEVPLSLVPEVIDASDVLGLDARLIVEVLRNRSRFVDEHLVDVRPRLRPRRWIDDQRGGLHRGIE